jgi:transcription initiation factor TFIIB
MWTGEAVEVKDVSDQRLVDLLTRVDIVAEELALAEAVRVRTAELVVEAWESRFMHGRSEDATIAACVSTACREAERPRPAPAIGEAIGVDASKLKSTFRKLVTELKLQATSVGSVDYVLYLGAELALDGESMAIAVEELRAADGIPGNPAGVAAAALYLVVSDCANAVTLSTAGQAAGVSKETVWQRVEDLRCMDTLEDFEKEYQKRDE